jgi:hypothetical protein
LTKQLYFAQAGRENNNLINFAHFFQKVVDAWSLQNMKMMPMILDFNRNNEISLLYRLNKKRIRKLFEQNRGGVTLKLL